MAPHQGRRKDLKYRVQAGPVVNTATDELVDGFVVQARVVETGRGWVITDLCISVASPDWEDQLLGDGKSFPPFLSSWLPTPDDPAAPIPGIGSTTLTSIKISELRESIRRSALRNHDHGGPDERWVQSLAESMRSPRRRTDHFYAGVAAVYLGELDSPDGVYKAMAERLHLAESTVVDYVKEARRRKLLTPAPGRGLKGGELTETARALLTKLTIRIDQQEDG